MLVESYCSIRNCKWYMGISELEIDDPNLYTDIYQCHVCAAFPKWPGIPVVINKGEDPHDKVLDGQVGDYVYQMKTKKEEEEERIKLEESIKRIAEEDEEE
jgi:hypothetical protein